MASHFTIPSYFTADDSSYSAAVSRMRKQNAALARDSDAAATHAGRNFGSLTKQILGYVGAGSLLAGGFQLGRFTFDEAKGYEEAVDAFRVIVSELNDAQFKPFQDKIDAVAKDTQKSGTEVAKAFEQIASKNAKFAETADGLGVVTTAAITLAKAARMDLGVASENIVGIMNEFSFGAEQANRTINTLAAGQAVGAASITQTAEAFVNLGPTAANANVTLEESVGLIQTLAKFSLFGADAGTALRGSIIKLQKAGLGYKSGQFSINDALQQTRSILDKVKTAKERDAIITSIFGIHNITAGQILLNNIDTYKEFTKAVTGTSEAQKGADINTHNLKTSVDQLSAAWVNLITGSDGAKAATTHLTNALTWIGTNLEGIVSVALTAGKAFLFYKGVMIATKIATVGYSVALGILNFAQGASIGLLEADAIAQRTSMIAKQLNAVATAGLTANVAALNAALLANPVTAVVAGLALIAGAVYVLTNSYNELSEAYNADLNKRVNTAMSDEIKTVESLAKRYIDLGYSKEFALKKAIEFERNEIRMQQIKNAAEVQSLKAQIREHQTFIPGMGIVETGTDDIHEKLLSAQRRGTDLAGQGLGLTNYTIDRTAASQQTIENKKKYDLSNTRIDEKSVSDIYAGRSINGERTEKMSATPIVKSIQQQAAAERDLPKFEITIKNDSDNDLELNTEGLSNINIKPKTTSTKILDRRGKY